MTDSAPPPATPQQRRRRFWFTVGEVVGVLALIIAGLNFWESHREHAEAERAAVSQAEARSAFVMTGGADAAGDRIDFRPLNPAQAIQSQQYLFPHAVVDHPIVVSAAQPRVERSWIDQGLRSVLATAQAPSSGEATAPLGVITTYVQDGETYTDGSLYRVGYAWRSQFLGGRKLRLQGVALAQRGVKGDLQAAVEQNWTANRPALPAR